MNSFMIPFLAASISGNPKELIIQFIVAVLILGAIACLIWCIERWISPIPSPGKTIIAVVMVICLLLWAVMNFLYRKSSFR